MKTPSHPQLMQPLCNINRAETESYDTTIDSSRYCKLTRGNGFTVSKSSLLTDRNFFELMSDFVCLLSIVHVCACRQTDSVLFIESDGQKFNVLNNDFVCLYVRLIDVIVGVENKDPADQQRSVLSTGVLQRNR